MHGGHGEDTERQQLKLKYYPFQPFLQVLHIEIDQQANSATG
jgi:hypothetical protein